MQIEVNGTRLWFDVEGASLVADADRMRARPTVLLVHGGPGGFDHSYFKPDFSRLAAIAQVVYLDLRNHGRSARETPQAWDWEVIGDDIHAFCTALGVDRPVVLGHSFGGPAVISYGARHPGHAGGLVIQSAFDRFDLDRIVEHFREVGGDGVAAIVRRSYNDEPVTPEEWKPVWEMFGHWVPGEPERKRIVANPDLNAVGGVLMQQVDLRREVASISDPTLVSVGELDPITPVFLVREMFEAMNPDIARFDVIPNAGHFPWRDAPDRYWPSLEDFIKSVTGSG